MTRLLWLVTCLALLVTPSALAHDTLFIGNSFVQSNGANGIAGVLRSLQEAQGGFSNTLIEDLSKGGYTLDLHAADANGDTTLREYLVTGAAEDNPWRYVVLQEQSQTAGFHANDDPFGVAPLWDISYAAAELLNGLIAGRGADTVFLMTWGYRTGGVMHTELFPDYPTMQALLAEGYELYATGLSTVQRGPYVAPVGLAFQKIHDDLVAAGDDPLAADSPFSALYSGDDRHPALQGSYLGGCVMYATLTGRDPRRLDWAPAGIDEPRRALLQDAAAAVTVDVAYATRVLPWGEAFRYPFLSAWSDLVPAGGGAAKLSAGDLRPTAVVDMIVAPVESLVIGDAAGGAGRVGVFEGGRLTVGSDLVVGAYGDGQVDIEGGEVRATTVRLAVEAGSHGLLDLRGGLLEVDLVQEGEGATDAATFLMTGGELRANEVDAAFQIVGGTWTVLGAGLAQEPFDLLEAGTLALTLPDSGAALHMNAPGLLMGTIVVSSSSEPVASGTYTLVQGSQLLVDGLTVDATALGDVETSWELADGGDGAQAIVLTVTGGAEPLVVEDATSGEEDVDAPVEDSAGPLPDEGGAATPSGTASGGCGAPVPLRWGWLLALALLMGAVWRQRVEQASPVASFPAWPGR